MGFLSVLSKIGKGILTVAGILKVPATLFSSAGGTLGKIAAYVIAVERLAENANLTTSGGLKLDSIAPLAEQVIKGSELVSGNEIADEKLFSEGTRDIVTGTVKILKSLKA